MKTGLLQAGALGTAVPALAWAARSRTTACGQRYMQLLGVLLACVLWFAASPAADAVSLQPETYATTTAWLNLRTEPNTDAAVLQIIPFGAHVYVHSGPHNTVWYQVTSSGTLGYVHGNYLTPALTGPSIRPKMSATTTAWLNLRTEPNTGAAVLQIIPVGAPVYIYNGPHNTVWYQVSYHGMTGYVHGAYLTDRAAVLQRVTTTLPYIAITVDDFYTDDFGWRTAPRLRQAANQAHAPLTLCPTGEALVDYERFAPEQAAEIKQLEAEGTYELCNHTFSHPVLPELGQQEGPAAERQEITRGAEAITAFFGRSPSPFVRPPFGSWEVSTQQAAVQAGYTHLLLWSIDSGDATDPEKSAQQLEASIACARAGDILLLHANHPVSAEALPLIITALREKGLELVDVSTLLASGQPAYSTDLSVVPQESACP